MDRSSSGIPRWTCRAASGSRAAISRNRRRELTKAPPPFRKRNMGNTIGAQSNPRRPFRTGSVAICCVCWSLSQVACTSAILCRHLHIPEAQIHRTSVGNPLVFLGVVSHLFSWPCGLGRVPAISNKHRQRSQEQSCTTWVLQATVSPARRASELRRPQKMPRRNSAGHYDGLIEANAAICKQATQQAKPSSTCGVAVQRARDVAPNPQSNAYMQKLCIEL